MIQLFSNGHMYLTINYSIGLDRTYSRGPFSLQKLASSQMKMSIQAGLPWESRQREDRT